ncbi:MAG: hypothetical protein QOF48_3225 [Verrucomicrobiota bacterium]
MKKIILIVLILPILLLVISFFLPSQYRVERVAMIQAKPDAIFPWLAQLRKWPEWTVWNTNYDSTLAYTFSGPAEGTGSEMSWTAKSGNGSLKLTGADVNSGVRYELNFDNGRFLSTGGVSLSPTGEVTRVTFFNEGNFGKNPVRRYFGLLMDKMMGGDFDKNLQGLKQKVETRAH